MTEGESHGEWSDRGDFGLSVGDEMRRLHHVLSLLIVLALCLSVLQFIVDDGKDGAVSPLAACDLFTS